MWARKEYYYQEQESWYSVRKQINHPQALRLYMITIETLTQKTLSL